MENQMSMKMNSRSIFKRRVDPQTKQINTIHQWNLDSVYTNKHNFNNKESRWCDLNCVPYYRNGLLYGPDVVEDKLTGVTYHNILKYRGDIWRAMMANPEQFKPETFFKVGDKLLVDHFQSQVRFEVTGFSPRAGNMYGTRYLNVDWNFDLERYDQDVQQKVFINDTMDYWTTNPIKENQQFDKMARPYSWYAVPQETFLKFQLLGLA